MKWKKVWSYLWSMIFETIHLKSGLSQIRNSDFCATSCSQMQLNLWWITKTKSRENIIKQNFMDIMLWIFRILLRRWVWKNFPGKNHMRAFKISKKFETMINNKYLCKHCFSSPWGPIEQKIPVMSFVWPCVGCCKCNFTQSLL